MKTIALKDEEYSELKNLKYALHADTFEQALVKLIKFYKEHEKAHCLEAPA